MSAQSIPILAAAGRHVAVCGMQARQALGAGAVLATVIPIRFQVEPLIVVESQQGKISLFPDSSRFARNSPLRRRGGALRIMRRLI